MPDILLYCNSFATASGRPKMDPDTEIWARPNDSVFDLRQIERISRPLAPHDKLIRDR
jgi:hypothetical protein